MPRRREHLWCDLALIHSPEEEDMSHVAFIENAPSCRRRGSIPLKDHLARPRPISAAHDRGNPRKSEFRPPHRHTVSLRTAGRANARGRPAGLAAWYALRYRVSANATGRGLDASETSVTRAARCLLVTTSRPGTSTAGCVLAGTRESRRFGAPHRSTAVLRITADCHPDRSSRRVSIQRHRQTARRRQSHERRPP